MERLINKYIVLNSSGQPLDNSARFFVLRLDSDPLARKAALYYTSLLRHTNPLLHEDMLALVEQYEGDSDEARSSEGL